METRKNILSKLRKTDQAEQELLLAVSCLNIIESQTVRENLLWWISQGKTDIEFHKQSIDFFGKLKGQYMFTNLRNKLSNIISWHKNQIEISQKEMNKNKKLIERMEC